MNKLKNKSENPNIKEFYSTEKFFDLSLDLMVLAGFDQYFKRLNPAWEKALGFTLAELKSRPYIEFVHPADRERTIKKVEQLAEGESVTGFENRYLCKNGSYRWLSWNSVTSPTD